MKILDKYGSVAKNVTAIVALLGLMCGTIWGTINIALNEKLEDYNMGLNQRVSAIEEYISDDIASFIQSTASKIVGGDTADVAKARVEKIIRCFPMLEAPDDATRAAYQVILDYYKTLI